MPSPRSSRPLTLLTALVVLLGLLTAAPAQAGPGGKPPGAAARNPLQTARSYGVLRDRAAARTPSFRARHSAAGRTPIPGAGYAATDRTTDTMYVSGADGKVAVVDVRRCSAQHRACPAPLAFTSSGHGPTAVVVDEPTHTVYQAYADDGTIAIIDGAHCNVHVTSGCSAAPRLIPIPAIGLTLDPRSRTFYAGSDVVRLIDVRTCNAEVQAGCTALATIPTQNAFNPLVDAATDTLYLPELGPDEGPGGLVVVDLRTCQAPSRTACTVVTRAAVGAVPFSALVDPADDTIYVSLVGERAVAAVSHSRCNAHDVSACTTAPASIEADLDPFWLTLDPRTHTVFVISDTSDTAGVIDTRRCSASSTAGCDAGARTRAIGGRPGWATVDPHTHTLYVAESADGYLSAYDTRLCNALTANGCRREAPATPATNCCQTVDPTRHADYLSMRETRQLGILDTAACNADRLAGCGGPVHVADVDQAYLSLAAVPATHTLYAYEFERGRLDVIDTATCNTAVLHCGPVASINVGDVSDIFVNRRTGTVYLARNFGDENGSSGDLSLFDGRTCNAGVYSGCPTDPFTVHIGEAVGAGWIDETTNTVYVGLTEDRVGVLNGPACDRHAAGCRVLATAQAGPGLLAISGDPSSHTLYATNFADGDLPGTVTTIDTRHCSARDRSACAQTWPRFDTPRSPFGVVVDPAHHLLIVTHFLASRVSLYDTRHCRAGDRTGCARSKRQIATDQITAQTVIDPVHRTAYVINGFEHDLSIISTSHPCRRHLCF